MRLAATRPEKTSEKQLLFVCAPESVCGCVFERVYLRVILFYAVLWRAPEKRRGVRSTAGLRARFPEGIDTPPHTRVEPGGLSGRERAPCGILLRGAARVVADRISKRESKEQAPPPPPPNGTPPRTRVWGKAFRFLQQPGVQ